MKGGTMGVKIREKPKGSGVWWVFINHRNNRNREEVLKSAWAEATGMMAISLMSNPRLWPRGANTPITRNRRPPMRTHSPRGGMAE